jgi:hypothetical protein
MIKEIIIIENFIEKTFLQNCIEKIESCPIDSSGQKFYMDGEDRTKM